MSDSQRFIGVGVLYWSTIETQPRLFGVTITSPNAPSDMLSRVAARSFFRPAAGVIGLSAAGYFGLRAQCASLSTLRNPKNPQACFIGRIIAMPIPKKSVGYLILFRLLSIWFFDLMFDIFQNFKFGGKFCP